MKSHTTHKVCAYCDCTYQAALNVIGDHFPIPKRHSGISTIPACPSCHSLKDRIPLRNWNLEMLNKVAADFPKVSRETRLFLGKVISLLGDIEDERIKLESIKP